MKLIKKILPLLAIVPTVSALSTNLSSCSKTDSNSCFTENEKLGLANFDEFVFKAKISDNTAMKQNAISIQADLIEITKKQKSDAFISSLVKAASSLINLEISKAIDDAKVKELWNEITSYLNKENDTNVLTIYNHFLDKLLEEPSKAKDKIDYMRQLSNDGIKYIVNKEISSNLNSYFIDFTFSALDNVEVIKHEQHPSYLCETFSSILKYLKDKFSTDEQIWEYVGPIFSTFLKNVSFVEKSLVEKILYEQVEQKCIPLILGFIKDKKKDLADTVAASTVSFLKKPAWITVQNVFSANLNLLNKWLDKIQNIEIIPTYVKALGEMGKSVFANLLGNSNDPNLSENIEACIDVWIKSISEAKSEEEAIVTSKWAAAQFMLDSSTLYESEESILNFRRMFEDQLKQYLQQRDDFGPLYVDAAHEFSIFYKDLITILGSGDDISTQVEQYLTYLKGASQDSVGIDIIRNSSEIMNMYLKAFKTIKDSSLEKKEDVFTPLNSTLKVLLENTKEFVFDKQMPFLSKDLMTFDKNIIVTCNKLLEDLGDFELAKKFTWLNTFTYHIFIDELDKLLQPTKLIGPEQIPLAQLALEYIYSTAALNWFRLMSDSDNMRPLIEMFEYNQVFLNYVEYDDIILGYLELYKSVLSYTSIDNYEYLRDIFIAMKEKLAVVLIDDAYSKKWKDVLEIAGNTMAAYGITNQNYHGFITNNFDTYYNNLSKCSNTMSAAQNKISAILADDENKLEVDLSIFEEFAKCFNEKVDSIKTLTNKQQINISVKLLSSWYKTLHDATSRDSIDTIEGIYKSELKKIIELK